MSNKAEKEMQHLIERGRPLILEIASARSCISSTRLAVEYLRGRNIKAEPLTVRAHVLSPAMVEKINQYGGLPEDKATIDRWYEESDQVWGIGLGMSEIPAEAGNWPGHLVALVENKYLLDLSIDQASRPERGLLLEPFFIEVPSDFLQGGGISVAATSGAELHYWARPADKSFLQAGDWRKLWQLKQILAQMG